MKWEEVRQAALGEGEQRRAEAYNAAEAKYEHIVEVLGTRYSNEFEAVLHSLHAALQKEEVSTAPWQPWAPQPCTYR